MNSVWNKETRHDYINRNGNNNTVVTLAKEHDVLLMGNLMKEPGLTKDLQNFEQILEILLEKGHKAEIETLAKSNKVDKFAKAKMRALLNKSQADHINRTLFLV
jgi:hypothetical protein